MAATVTINHDLSGRSLDFLCFPRAMERHIPAYVRTTFSVLAEDFTCQRKNINYQTNSNHEGI